jgi:hypothetical protein
MTRAEALAGALSTLAELRALEAKKAKLMEEMERSLALMQLWPEAFEQGAVKTSWKSKMTGRDRRTGAMVYDLSLRITDGAGTVKEFPQSEVSAVLWPMPLAGRLP